MFSAQAELLKKLLSPALLTRSKAGIAINAARPK
jgi:hypothetical protein